MPDTKKPARKPPPVRALLTGRADVTPEERAMQSAFLQEHLGQPPPPNPHQPALFTLTNPAPYSTPDWTDDPLGELAVRVLQDQYPGAFSRVPAVHVGRGMGKDGILGRTWSNNTITLANSKDKFNEILDTLRHELGHVMGLPDFPISVSGGRPGYLPKNRPPSAYNISLASGDLHKDIELAPDTDK